ncbi:MAG TPA: helix-turn-helix transcriptional regulator [Gemmatimonadales bacterium]|nr:helix-turn-helix transcriptional regulator [Gemmatimonadales bacterium]
MTPTRLRLESMRQAKGLSQAALARASGVSRTLIGRIENGERPNVTLEVLDKLADALGVAPAELLEFIPTRKRR